jgi:hypothetical protein
MQLQLLAAFGDTSPRDGALNRDMRQSAELADLLTGEPRDAGRGTGDLRMGTGSSGGSGELRAGRVAAPNDR